MVSGAPGGGPSDGLSDMHRAARAYAGRGWPVFPCHPNDKRPLTEEGFKDASANLARVDEWWARWPDAMIGVPTGPAIGAFVVDIDAGSLREVLVVLDELCAACGAPVPAGDGGGPQVTTPRGGLHLYFAWPEGQELGNRANLLKAAAGTPMIDVRGDGGYVIAPPSVRRGPRAKQDGCDGVGYGWLAETSAFVLSPADAPQELIDLITRQGRFAPEALSPAPQPLSQATPTLDERARKYALSALEAETRGVAGQVSGGRNDALNRAAYSLGQLVGAGALSESVVLAALEDAAVQCGLVKDDGLRAVRKTIRSGLEGGRREPRDMSDVGASRPGRPRAPDAPFPDAHPAAPLGRGTRDSRGERQPAKAGGGGDGSAPPEGGAGASGGGEGGDDAIYSANTDEPQNDTGNARRLMRWFGGDMLIVRAVGQHFWAGTHWECRGGEEAFQRFAQQAAELIAGEAHRIEPSKRDRMLIEVADPLMGRPRDEMSDEEKAALKAGIEAAARLAKRRGDRRKFSISCGNTNRINGMLAQVRPHITVPPEALDAEALAINVRNGTLRIVKEPDPECPDPDVVRLRWTVRLDPHDREDLNAKVMPVDYDEDAECPKWQAFMERFQPKEGISRFLRAFHGYALTGLMGEQIFVYNYGLGANGKSTFMEAVARLQGNYAQVLPAEALTGDNQRRGDQATPEFARLPGARLVRCAELPRGHGFRESTIKMLTGGEAILVRHLHERFFELQPSFKAIGSGNDRPNIGGVDEGIWRRMKLVPWEVTIPAAERRPMEKVLAEFAAEGPGLLNWLLDGLLDYLENGLIVPQEIQSATESYRNDMDPVGEFTRACVAPLDGSDVTARDMYTAYVAWCHANSVKPFAEKTFAVIMVQKGFDKESGRIRKYKNVVLKDVPDDPEEREKYSDTGWRGL